MKYKFLYPLLFLACNLVMPACTDSDDENGGNDNPPAGALPSDEFVLNTLPAEPYAEDAIRLVAETSDAPFYSLELMGDGYYLLAAYNSYANPSYAGEAGQAHAKRALHKNRTAVRTRSTRDENGTITTPDGLVYGRYTKIGDKKYRLSDGVEIALQNASGSNGSVVYKDSDGRISTVYVDVFKSAVTGATESICRAWECNSFEMWIYWNRKYLAHGKQVYKEGKVDSYFKAVGNYVEKDEFMDSDDEYCYKIVFTPENTYICFFLDGEVNVTWWKWTDEAQGTLYWYDAYDDGHCTVRFAGNQMRVYEDYTENEEGEDLRLVAVSTLTVLAE